MPSSLDNPKKPKITGRLNNCALGCSLPILLSDIKKYALAEKEGTLTDSPLLKNYTLLKSVFADYYVIDDKTFTWQQFHGLIAEFDNNYGEQLLFTPVMREFIAKVTGAPERLTTLNNGRYRELLSDEAARYFYDAFQINVTELQPVESESEPQYFPIPISENHPETRRAELYLRGGHFELLASEDIHKSDSDKEDLHESFEPVQDILEKGESNTFTLEAFEVMKEQVKAQYNRLYDIEALDVVLPESSKLGSHGTTPTRESSTTLELDDTFLHQEHVIPESPSNNSTDTLLEKVQKAFDDYEANTTKLITKLSFWHRHGSSGVNRARRFLDDLQTSENKSEDITNYLQNENNGNTNPHSFRTILLKELINDGSVNLTTIAANFGKYCDDYVNDLRIDESPKLDL
jgi:hypothetical protein